MHMGLEIVDIRGYFEYSSLFVLEYVSGLINKSERYKMSFAKQNF
jgi:hypothetical protein